MISSKLEWKLCLERRWRRGLLVLAIIGVGSDNRIRSATSKGKYCFSERNVTNARSCLDYAMWWRLIWNAWLKLNLNANGDYLAFCLSVHPSSVWLYNFDSWLDTLLFCIKLNGRIQADQISMQFVIRHEEILSKCDIKLMRLIWNISWRTRGFGFKSCAFWVEKLERFIAQRQITPIILWNDSCQIEL